LLLLCAFVLVQGCDRLNPPKTEYVYVSVNHAFLRDRVATVSNRVAEVENGQRLQVVEHGRRWVRVTTAKKESGWIEERDVIDEKVYDAFVQLSAEHKQDPVTATAVLNSDLSMRIAPGRDKQRFYLIPEKTKVELLAKASAPKVSAAAAAAPVAKPAAPKDAAGAATAAKDAGNTTKTLPSQGPGLPVSGPQGAAKTGPEVSGQSSEAAAAPSAAAEPVAAPQMEDWWLARDETGHTGWLLGKELDADVPAEIEAYGEGQRFIGSWPFTKVNDAKAKSTDLKSADREVTEYLTVMAPPQSGQAFDFDQVRLFTWNRKWHRYETGFRLHPIQGFLPVRIFTESTPEGDVPAFSFLIAGDGNVKVDTESGIARPTLPRTIEFALIDERLKRIGTDTGPIPMMHEAEKKSGDKKGKEGKGKKGK
jgi:SH3-like domain-containing protein